MIAAFPILQRCRHAERAINIYMLCIVHTITLKAINVLRRKKKFFTSPCFIGSGIRDLGSGIRDGKKSGSRIRDKHPGSATLVEFINTYNLSLVKFAPEKLIYKERCLKNYF